MEWIRFRTFIIIIPSSSTADSGAFMYLKLVKEFQESDHPIWQARLFALNIRYVEQLGTLLAAPEGRYALERLGVPVESVQKAVEPVLIDRFGLSLSQPLQAVNGQMALLTRAHYSMGYQSHNSDPFKDASFGNALPDPPKISSASYPRLGEAPALSSEVMLGFPPYFPARDQGRRGTCVAFTVMGMYQLMHTSPEQEFPIQLSPQYLYFRAKYEDLDNPDEEGLSLDVALSVLMSQGCCLEHQLGYSPRHDIRQDYQVRGFTVQQRNEARLKSLAAKYKIGSYRAIPCTVDSIKSELAAGRPVGVGIAVYKLAWYNSLARSRGEIAMPPMDTSSPQVILFDTYLGGHAVVLVGYKDNPVDDVDSHRPGGGYFIFRNSWGDDWGYQNEYARGYGCIPYEYLHRFCLEAVVIEELLASPTKSKIPAGSAATGSGGTSSGPKGKKSTTRKK